MPRPFVSCDFETRSRIDLKKVGQRRYAAEAEALCLSYAVEDDDPELWLPGDPFPKVFGEAMFRGWNLSFERAIWELACRRLYGWPECPAPERFIDTQARALLAGLPASLDQAAIALGLPQDQQKDKRGKYLIQTLCKPRAGKFREDPELLQELYAYCKQDVRVERAIGRGLPPLPDKEHRIWCLTERMNSHGVPIDVPAARGAVAYVGRATTALADQAAEAAGGFFTSINQIAKIQLWCESRGVILPNLTADTVDEVLEGDPNAVGAILAGGTLPDDMRLVLEARRVAGLASVKKFAAAVERANSAGRVCDTHRYHGAGTGRFSSVGLQVQNLKRPTLSPARAARWLAHLATKQTVPGVSYARGLALLGDCVRGMIRAERGHLLLASDYSQIELRVLLWLAMDEKNLQEIRDGLDPYKTMAALIFSIPYDRVNKDQRQAGKTAVLGCGYQSGAGGMQKFAVNYGFRWTEEEAQRIVDAYRAKHPRVVSFWWELQTAAFAALEHPGETYRCRRLFVRVKKNRKWLEIMLPSGRPLRYYRPKVRTLKDWPYQEIEFYGLDTYTRRWGKTTTYGGKLVENVTQGLSRDIMADGMLRAAAVGLNPIMTVHDEVVCHPRVYGSDLLRAAEAPVMLDKLNRCLLQLPAWAEGLPLEVEGWTGDRYRK